MKLRRQFWLNYSYCCRKTCSALRNGAKQRLAAEAHRAVVNGPSDFCTIPTLGAQATAAGQLIKSPCGFRCWQILLQKSFWGDERNFLGPLMRFKTTTAARISATVHCICRGV